MKMLNFYENSYQFKSLEVTERLQSSFSYIREIALTELLKQYTYRPTTQTLWCELIDDNTPSIRYTLNVDTKELSVVEGLVAIKLTELEKGVLLGINTSDYGDGLGEAVWTWSAIDEEDGKKNSGVISSLVKKGLVVTHDSGDDATIALTILGQEVCIKNNLLGKYSV